LGKAVSLKTEAGLVSTALNTQVFPVYPNDCRRWQTSGVNEGDRLDLALLKTDQALNQANLRIKRCSTWYDGLKKND
jgi:hypothetical protein